MEKRFSEIRHRTLGYFTAKFKPQTGRNLKVELLNAKNEAKDAFGMVEITGKKLDDGVARDDKNARGRLSIVEIEIYEKVSESSGLLMQKTTPVK